MLAVVPIKSFTQAKQRLASLLSEQERAELSYAMARDVLKALRATPEISRIVICSGGAGGARIADLAREFQADCIAETDLKLPANVGLNAVIAQLAQRLLSGGVRKMLVVHADLPLLQPSDIGFVARTLNVADVAIAPDHARDGSNLLAWRLDCGFEPMYGEHSFVRHCQQAEARKLDLRICPQPSARWDIDKPGDLLTLTLMRPSDRGLFTQDYLRASGIAARLSTGRTPELIAASIGRAGAAKHVRH
jgi:2-phospho-L-lactate guanylyltransferase